MNSTAGKEEIPVFYFDDMTSDSILDEDIYERIFSISDAFTRTQIKFKLLDRAKSLGVKGRVDLMLKEYEKEQRKRAKEEQMRQDFTTRFEPDSNGTEYTNLYCGGWEATEDGIFSLESAQVKQTVCYHPILPVRRLKNLQTGEEQITLAFKRNNIWEERTVPKIMIATARSITELAKYGVAVTSENAKLLVRYLSDVENWNADIIDLQHSTSKCGWHGKSFIPYDQTIRFDGEMQFRELFESISEFGEYSVWKECICQLRQTKSVELRMALAASFGSVLVKHIGIMPFIVDFWTMTEAGKTVLNMVAASVWGNPAEGKYIGDFKTTDIALEARLDMLNHMPVFLDDTSKASKRIRENFESVIYDMCSGKGKSRSNLKIGVDRERSWQNIIICNGERPLSSYTFQGGAINRIVEVECREKIFQNPAAIADTVRYNYGFAGRDFAGKIKGIDTKEIRQIHQSYVDRLTTSNSMQKQVIAVAALLTADQLATELIFQDDMQLACEDVQKLLANKNEISDGERCYRYILDLINEKYMNFSTAYAADQYGYIEKETTPYKEDEDREIIAVYFYVNPFEELLEKKGYSRKSFTSWADRNGLLIHEKGRDTCTKRIDGNVGRFIGVKVDYDFDSSKEPIFD